MTNSTYIVGMEITGYGKIPVECPACSGSLLVTRMQCPACGTEVAGAYPLSRLAALREPYASLIEMFLRVRGNVKDMERELGLSYPTVRARLEEALSAAGFGRDSAPGPSEADLSEARAAILRELDSGEITPAEAAARLREFRGGRER